MKAAIRGEMQRTGLVSGGAVGRRLPLFSRPDVTFALPLPVPLSVALPDRLPHVFPASPLLYALTHWPLLNPLPPALPLSVALIIVPAAARE